MNISKNIIIFLLLLNIFFYGCMSPGFIYKPYQLTYKPNEMHSLIMNSINLICTSGLLYTKVTEPYVTNMDKTLRGEKVGENASNSLSLRDPITRINFSAQWKSRSIGDAAEKANIENIYYADIYTFSILGGMWKQKIIRVWGD